MVGLGCGTETVEGRGAGAGFFDDVLESDGVVMPSSDLSLGGAPKTVPSSASANETLSRAATSREAWR